LFGSAEPFGPESFDPESFDPELTTEGLTADGLVAGDILRFKVRYAKMCASSDMVFISDLGAEQ
jgi:hypothetical protein